MVIITVTVLLMTIITTLIASITFVVSFIAMKIFIAANQLSPKNKKIQHPFMTLPP